jgi:hypothetical protein
MRNAFRLQYGNVKQIDHLGDLSIDGMILLNGCWKIGCGDRNGFIWLRIATRSGLSSIL